MESDPDVSLFENDALKNGNPPDAANTRAACGVV